MIIGIGLDVVELERFTGDQFTRLAARILTKRERAQLVGGDVRQREYVAGRFAAKEALSKAAGTGIGRQVSWHDIEVLAEATGRPTITVSEEARTRLGWEDVRIHVTITHSRTIAAAQVVLERG